MFTYQQLCGSYLKCRKNKRNTINQLAFEINAEQNLLRLQEAVNDRTYRPSRSICFVVDKPKLREIFAADFKDRVMHHVLVEHMEAIAERRFIFDSFACRKGKGTHHAVKRLQGFMRSVTKNNSKRAYCLQLDIRSFFVSIDKDILFGLVKKYTRDPDMLWLAEVIIFNDCTQNCRMTRGKDLLQHVPKHKSLFWQNKNKGLPIGNLTSQFFANLYLSELDQFVKQALKCRFYLRYADDALILDPDREQLQGYMKRIIQFLKDELSLDLHQKKTVITPIGNGVDYLGYVVRPFYILVRRRVANHLKQKIFNHVATRESFMSYLGHFKHANAYRLTRKMEGVFNDLSALS